MSPRRLDPESIDSKIARMEVLLRHLHGMGPVTTERLVDDLNSTLVVERISTVLVDLAVAVNSHVMAAAGLQQPLDYASSFSGAAKAGAIDGDLAARLVPSTRMRNVLIHRYGEIDPAKVSAAVPPAHADYNEYIRQISRWLLARQEGG